VFRNSASPPTLVTPSIIRKKSSWGSSWCKANDGFTLKRVNTVIKKGPTGKNCNQQHAGNDCWGIWRTDTDVPAYCIATHVFSPYWNSGSLAANACADTYDTSCQVRTRASAGIICAAAAAACRFSQHAPC
jgi:hypothetical protein